ncbi:MAG: sterile alpha motif-like domain-containing protein [Thermomicrobiales bacterium]|nr:sterile alpha motif-like domain-containing protein [Thermomicrobiales bacterium]
MTGNGSFLTWLALQAQRDDPVGDCARDMLDDPEWPSEATTYATARVYLESVQASSLAIAALREAWDEWQRRR